MKSRNMLRRLNSLVPPQPPEDPFLRWYKEHREYAFYEEIVELREIVQESGERFYSLREGDPIRVRLEGLMEKIEDRRKRGKRPKVRWQRPRDRWGPKPPSEDDPSLFYSDDEGR
jgi:hypothetical protein